jgi:PAS domain S-box-containing protein
MKGRVTGKNHPKLHERVIEDLPLMVFRYHQTSLNITFANTLACEFLGKTIDQLRGMSLLEFIPQENHAFIKNHINMLTTSNPTCTYEHPINTPLGKRWVRRIDRFIENKGKKVIECQSVAEEITQQASIIGAFSLNRENLKTLLNAPDETVMIVDREGRIVDINETGAQCQGKSSYELIGVYAADLSSSPPLFGDKMMKVFETGHLMHFDSPSKEIWLDIWMYPIRESSGTVSRVAVLSRDITELRKTEEALQKFRMRLSQFIDFLPDATFAIDTEGKVIVWNRAMEELTGIKSEAMLGKSDYAHARPFYGEKRPILADYILNPELKIKDRYIYFQKKNDSVLAEGHVVMNKKKMTLWSKASPMYDSRGNIIGAVQSLRDITDWKKTEEALRLSEAKYRDIFENVSDFLYIHDLKGNIIEANPASKKVTGYTESDLRSMNIKALIPARFKGKYQDYRQRLIEKGHDEGLIIIKTRTGPEKILEYRNSLILDKDGWLAGVRGSAHDITARIKAEKQVRKERDFSMSIIQTSPAFYDAIDPQGKTILMNDAMLKALGYTLPEVVGQDYYGMFIPEGDRDICKTAIHRMISSNESVVHENRILTKDGRSLFVQWQGKPVFREDGSLDFVFGIGIDITSRKQAEAALKESEERYRLIAENARDVIWVLNDKLEYTYISPSVMKLRGYTSEEAMHQTLAEVLTPESYQRAMTIITQGRELEKKERDDFFKTLELELICRDGSTVWTEVKVSIIFDETGNPSEFLGITRDISERKKTKEDLRESEERFKQVAENADKWIWEVDAKGLYTYSSSAIERILGYSPDELVGQKHFYDLFAPEVREDLKTEALAAFDRKAPFRNFISASLHKNGKTVILETNGTSILDEKGNLIGYRGTDTNITERTEAERALRESEEKYRLLVETANESIIVIQDGMIRFINSKTIGHFGYTREELFTTPINEFLHPEDRDILEDRYRKLIKGEILSGVRSFRIVDKNKNIRWVEVNSALISWKGRPAALSFLADISERMRAEEALRQSEERFRKMAETSPEIFWMFTPGLEKVVYISPSFDRIFGISSEQAYRNPQAWLDLVHPDDRETVNTIFDNDHGQDSICEFRIIRKEGSIRWLRNRRSSIRDTDGKVITVTGITEDITDKKTADEEKKIYEARLMRSQKLEAIGTLAGGIAHDFNNILSAIIGYTELAQDNLQKDNSTYAYLEEVLHAGDRARDLVKQILTFSRQIESERRPVKVFLLIKEVLKLLRSSLPSTITIVDHIDSDSGSVFADPAQIHQVIMNLCTNAYQAMINTGGELTVSLSSVYLDSRFTSTHPPLKQGHYLKLSVTDTGAGMDEETLKRIFDPFFTTKEKGKGTGLGLATVHGIVSELGGAIVVTSRLRMGSSFDVYLEQYGGNADKTGMRKVSPMGNGESILLVDDEDAILHFTQAMLHQLGYQVYCESSGIEALRTYKADPGRFDLIITDQTMPGMTGSQLAHEILKIQPDVPIILMTGFSETITPEEAVCMGIRDFLEKPFNKHEIATAIHRSL